MGIKHIATYDMPTKNDFPKNKLHWQIDPDKAVLLIHDMQKYFLGFFDQDSTLIQTLISHIAELKRWAVNHNIPVIYTAQPHEQTFDQRGLLSDLWGDGITAAPVAQQYIHDDITPDVDDIIIDKWRYSAFERSNLYQTLKNWDRDQLLITGVYAHIGCTVTAINAFMQDIKPFLIADALGDFSLQKHLLALDYVANTGGMVVGTQDVITSQNNRVSGQWLKDKVMALLGEETDIDPNESLIMYGLDSLKIMQLSADLQAIGKKIGFEKLGINPTLNNWLKLIK
ncbi:isochorismatase family protein [Moraxella marmotae]|uniref:isochorismatase family protein n=1 Tax=Moraxella marmotae TaxID=3344520 RepID=UPI0035F3104B